MENEIWIAKVFQTDLKNNKIRPVLIVSKNNYNKKHEDIIGFWITTNLEHDFSLKIKKEDIKSGELFDESAIRCDGIIRLNKELLIKKIVKLKPQIKEKVIKKFNTILF